MLNCKLTVTGGGNTTLRLARKLIASKRGLAIAEKGEESDEEMLLKYDQVLDGGLSGKQMEKLSALAKGASRRRRPTVRATSLVSPVQ